MASKILEIRKSSKFTEIINEIQISEPSLLLTFDDGFSSNRDIAEKILNQ